MNLLFVISKYNTGGIKRSFDNLISFLKESTTTNISLLTFERIQKEFSNDIKNLNINVIKAPRLLHIYQTPFCNFSSFFEKALKLIIGLSSRIIGRELTIKILIRLSKSIKGMDCAISYSHSVWASNGSKGFGGGCEYYVQKKVKSKKKIAWVHGEPSFLGYNKKIIESNFSMFDKVVLVSQSCKDNYNQLLGYPSKNAVVAYNLVNTKEIINKSRSFELKWNSQFLHIVSVARLENKAKRIDRGIKAIKKLVENGHNNIKYHIVGDGPDKEYLIDLVRKEKMEPYIVFEGKQLNPYPYLASANIVLITSDSESFGIVLAEAITLNKCIVTTNFPAAFEIAEEYTKIKFCEKSENSIGDGLSDMIEKRKYFEKVTTEDFDTRAKRQIEAILCPEEH